MRWTYFIAVMVLGGAAALGQSTSPATGALEFRAGQDFKDGKYAEALPKLQKLVVDLAGSDKVAAIEEEIRVCQKNIAAGNGQPAAVSPVDAQAAAGDRPPMAEARKPHERPPEGQVLDIEIKQLGNFDYDPEVGGMIPDDVRKLNGIRFRTRGYMEPLDQADSISEFLLVPTLFICCNGQGPQVQHTIAVHCPPGKGVGYYGDVIQVEGTLTVQEKKDDGFVISIFELNATSIKAVPR